MLKFTKAEEDRIRGGDLDLLRTKLEKLDAELVSRLRFYKEDVGSIQGASQVTEALLKILQ